MNYNHTIAAILRGAWMIEKSWAEAHLPFVLSILKGQPMADTVQREGLQGFEKPFVVDPKTMAQYALYRYDWNTDQYVPNPNIPQNSVGVVPITGPITKYTGSCGEPGAITQSGFISEMSKRNNIIATVMVLDTPGGEARAANHFNNAIANSKKPVLAQVDGISASLGMFPVSSAAEVYASSENDQVGSVGALVTLADYTGWFEKEGIKVKEIYAPQSTDKNKDYHDALAGDETAIKADLEKLVNNFISHVKTNRPQAAGTVDKWGTGKMFYADEAQKLGLIDGVRSLEQVISKAAWLGKRNK